MRHAQLGVRQYLRCDWETILVRLRPLESTWLDMLVGVDRGCLVRTRPRFIQRAHQKSEQKNQVFWSSCIRTVAVSPKMNEAPESDTRFS